MNFLTFRLALGAAALSACALPSAWAQNISLSINQPGVYGRVDIGQPLPQVAWVHPRPVIITQAPVMVQRAPIYLYVPPAQSNNWGRYCGQYNACAQPVIFVQEGWVRERHARYGHGHGQGYERGHEKEDREDRKRHYKEDKEDRKHNKRGRGHDRDDD